MPKVKKFLPTVTEIWVWMDTQTDTQDQLIDSPLVTGPVMNNDDAMFNNLNPTEPTRNKHLKLNQKAFRYGLVVHTDMDLVDSIVQTWSIGTNISYQAHKVHLEHKN